MLSFQGLLRCISACLGWWGTAIGFGSLLTTCLNCTSQTRKRCSSESGKNTSFAFSFTSTMNLSIYHFVNKHVFLLSFSGLFLSDTTFLAGTTAVIHPVPIGTASPRRWKAQWWMIVSWPTFFLRLDSVWSFTVKQFCIVSVFYNCHL